jgi:hypothetical protein
MYVEQNPLDSAPDDVWALAMLGGVIGSYVDREVNKATVIDGTTGYGLDEYGRMYPLGQPTQAATLPPPQQPVNGMLLLLVLGAVFVAVSR